MSAKVLVVDDEPDVVRYFTAVLEENGYATSSAADGVEALAKVRSEHPDLVTLDIAMPNQSGVKVYREMKDPVLRKIPVVCSRAAASRGCPRARERAVGQARGNHEISHDRWEEGPMRETSDFLVLVVDPTSRTSGRTCRSRSRTRGSGWRPPRAGPRPWRP